MVQKDTKITHMKLFIETINGLKQNKSNLLARDAKNTGIITIMVIKIHMVNIII
jgi:hypothetical protein